MASSIIDLNTASNQSPTTWSFIQKTMANGIRWRKGSIFLFAGIITIMIVMYLFSTKMPASNYTMIPNPRRVSEKPPTTRHVNWFWIQGYTVWPEYSHVPIMTHDYFKTKCVKVTDYSIIKLADISKEWGKSSDILCKDLFKKFEAMFTVEARKAHLAIPPPFRGKVAKWLGNDKDLIKELYDQDVIHMVSKFTREQTIFNPIRDKRPVLPPDVPEQKYVDDIVNKTAASCDFCKFRDMTAEHLFGRVESQHSFTASNVFKLDSLHALVALKKHHPLNWNREQFMDLMSLTVTWLEKAKLNHPTGQFPSLIWDILPKCGASQVHPHIHVMLDPSRYHGPIESWRQGAQDYHNSFGSNYFTDMVSMYSALNLTATYGNATAFASLVPKKDHEVVVMAKEANADFFTLLYFTLRALVDDLHVFCYSMGIGYPALGDQKGRIPAYARVITRGAVTDIRTDMSSLELFTATNVNIDPWKTIQLVRNSIQKRSKSN